MTLPAPDSSAFTPTRTVPPPEMTDLPAVLHEHASICNAIADLEERRTQLAEILKTALGAGHRVRSGALRAELRASTTTEYPLDRFREVFGDAAALEVTVIDRKKAETLATGGDLDAARLQALTVTRPRSVSLRVVPR